MITSTMNETGGTRHMKFLTGILAASLLLGLTACSTTHQVRGTPEESGFLKDYSLLKPGQGRRSQAGLLRSGRKLGQIHQNLHRTCRTLEIG